MSASAIIVIGLGLALGLPWARGLAFLVGYELRPGAAVVWRSRRSKTAQPCTSWSSLDAMVDSFICPMASVAP